METFLAVLAKAEKLFSSPSVKSLPELLAQFKVDLTKLNKFELFVKYSPYLSELLTEITAAFGG